VTLKHRNLPHTFAKEKSVPWWTDALTTLRKRTNALRRRYQRTLNNEELRKNRNTNTSEGKGSTKRQLGKKKLTHGNNTATQHLRTTREMRCTSLPRGKHETM